MSPHEPALADVIVVCGVSGSGKTTIGRMLAGALDRPFLDADDLHPVENIAKMSAGIPLTDDDRAPWLRAVADAASRRPCVLACSALRRTHREALRGTTARGPHFVQLVAPSRTIGLRLAARQGHFMPAALLESQIATLEPLHDDESGTTIEVAGTPDAIVSDILRHLGRLPQVSPSAASFPRTPPCD